MKKEAPEQTTVSGQKPLSLILDEIEERANTATKSVWNSAQLLRLGSTDVPALIKALRRAIEAIRIMGDNQTLMVRSDICPRIEFEQIAAILNQK
jgi:hypothetical protein